MSVDKSTHLVLGVKLTGAEADGIGLPYDDEKWLPMIEGRPGTELRVLYSQAGSDRSFYIGRELFASDDRDSVSEVSKQLNFIPDFIDLLAQFSELGIPHNRDNVGLWFFDTFN